MNFRIPIGVTNSANLPQLEDESTGLLKASADLTTVPFTPVVGHRISAIPDWNSLPTEDGGAALKVMREGLKLSYVIWQKEDGKKEVIIKKKKDGGEKVVEMNDDGTPVEEGGEKRIVTNWTKLPDHAKPFPWDGQELQPVAEHAGLTVRAIGTFVDADEGKTVPGLPTSISRTFRIGFGEKMKQALLKIKADGRIGFHCSSEDGQDGLVVFIGFHPTDGAEDKDETGGADDGASSSASAALRRKCRGPLHFLVQRVPDDEKAPMQTVKEGILGKAVGSLPVVEQNPNDEVTLLLHLKVDGAPNPDSTSGDGPSKTTQQQFSTSEPFIICLRSRMDRDLATAAALILQSESNPFLEAQELEAEVAAETEGEHDGRGAREQGVVCRVRDALFC